MTKLTLGLAVLTALLTTTALPSIGQDKAFSPVTQDTLNKPSDDDWLMWRRTQDNWGYSPLKQVNKENVGTLGLAWSRAIAPGVLETTPLVHDGVMYLPEPGGTITAVDATTGDLKWEYKRQLPADIADYVLINGFTRSISIYDNKIISLTSDGYVIAVNAETGQLDWESQIYDYKNASNFQTAGATVVNGKILSGRSCDPRGGPEACFISAHDVNTGEELWRTYTVPRPGEPGSDTWGNIPYESRWHVGSWGTPAYDPELNLAYFGTSVTSPYNKFTMGADDPDLERLYQTSTLAVDADTGEIKWYQQHIRDQWDLDHPFERILLNTKVSPDAAQVPWIKAGLKAGEERKVVTGIPGKTGIFYSIDRATGEFLWARPTVHQNVVLDIDTSNGRATMNKDLFFKSADDTVTVCPSWFGGKDWPASAYSPLTNVIYEPLQNLCMEQTPTGDEPVADELGQVDTTIIPAPDTDQLGTIQAVNAETGDIMWKFQQRANTLALVTTGGGLVFGGDTNRRFRALDQDTGEVLWETILGAPVGGFPISYAVNGKQYIAVAAGNSIITGGELVVTPEIQSATAANGLYVFALPDKK